MFFPLFFGKRIPIIAHIYRKDIVIIYSKRQIKAIYIKNSCRRYEIWLTVAFHIHIAADLVYTFNDWYLKNILNVLVTNIYRLLKLLHRTTASPTF